MRIKAGYKLRDIAGDTVPSMEKIQYTFRYDDVEGRFGRFSGGYILTLIPDHEAQFQMSAML